MAFILLLLLKQTVIIHLIYQIPGDPACPVVFIAIFTNIDTDRIAFDIINR